MRARRGQSTTSLSVFLAWARDINSINDRQNNRKTFWIVATSNNPILHSIINKIHNYRHLHALIAARRLVTALERSNLGSTFPIQIFVYEVVRSFIDISLLQQDSTFPS